MQGKSAFKARVEPGMPGMEAPLSSKMHIHTLLPGSEMHSLESCCFCQLHWRVYVAARLASPKQLFTVWDTLVCSGDTNGITSSSAGCSAMSSFCFATPAWQGCGADCIFNTSFIFVVTHLAL